MLRTAGLASIVLGALLMLTGPSYAADVHEFRLDNGMLVLLKENHNAPVINLNVVYRVGSKYERPGITGISHLIEHMMFKTTENLPLGEFDRRLKAVGADNNAYTWLDQTVYHETIAADQVDVALELEAERMRNLSCLAEDHEFEMTVVRNELEQRDDTPFTMLYEELLSFAFKAHPYQIPTIGWKADVEGITTAEIRAYYDRYYHPDNAFIVAVGDFEPDEMFDRIERHFGHLPSGEVELPRLPAEPPQLGERRFEVERSGQLDYLLIGWHVPESEHPDSYALVVLGQLLGQGRTSRLYRALVDSGQCAMAQAWASSFSYADPFLFFATAAMNPGVSPDDVEQVVYDEVERIISEGVTEQELGRAKKQARVSFVYDRDSIEAEAQGIVYFELMSGYRDIDKYLPGIEAVTSEDVQRVASEYLTKRNRTVGRYLAQRAEPAAGPLPTDAADEMPTIAPPRYRPTAPLTPGASPQSAAADDEAGDGHYAAVTQLSNGLKVVIRENHNNSTVSVSGLVPAGKIDDPVGQHGLSGFGAAMLMNGTVDHTKQELAEIMEDAGLELGFVPSREHFMIAGRSLTEDFELLLDLLAEQLLHPSFPEDELERTRQRILAGLLESSNDTFDTSFATGRDLIYGVDHPFSGRFEGRPEDIATITRDDLRSWHREHVVPDGAVLTIVGDVDSAAALEAVRQRLAGWSGRDEDRAGLLARGAEFDASQAGQRHVVRLEEKSNATVTWLGPGTSKLGAADWAAPRMASFLLGGDMYSRLNERLRIKEGLTYGSFCWFSNGCAAGPLCIAVQVNPENIDAAIAATNEELERFVDEGPTDEELALAKSYLSGNHPVRLATNAAVAAALTEAVYLDWGVDYIVGFPTIIEQLTLEQVAAAASEYMQPDQLTVVIAGTVE